MAMKKESARKPENKNTSNDNFKITIKKDGPYEVSGGVPLEQNVPISNVEGIPYEWRTGKKYPVQDNYSLCRCGESMTPPFCDGTHSHIEFDGTETAVNIPFLKQAQLIEGENIDLKDAEDFCSHMGFCDGQAVLCAPHDHGGGHRAPGDHQSAQR